MSRNLYKIGSILLSLIFVLAVGIIIVRAQDSNPQGQHFVFIPVAYNQPISGHSITGQVISPQNVPISGATIRTNQGQAAITDQNGAYSLDGLNMGTYTLVPSLGGMTFSPSSNSVIVPPDVSKVNFTAQVNCSDAIINGGFENNTGWSIPVTQYTAGYSTAQAHSGSWSMRTGIVNPADNTYSYSSARQVVTIPSNTTSAYLTFWIQPFSGEVQGLSLPPKPANGKPLSDVPLSADIQYVLILDNNFNIINTLIWQLSNSGTWTQYQFSLTQYAGQTIWVHFGTYNDGYNGISSMYVDDVSLNICPSGATPQPSPTPGPCYNMLDNPSFETFSDWEIPTTAYSAGYSTAQAHTGSWSMRTGITQQSNNVYSYSDFRQAVYIPYGTAPVTARFWLYSLSGESTNASPLAMITPTGKPFDQTVLSGDLQYVLILDQYQNWIDTLVWQLADEGYWHYYQFDLRQYAGQTIYLQFGTYNDGLNGITSMYVDDVSLDNCVSTPTPGPSPTPTMTFTPGPSPTPTQPTITPSPTATFTPQPCQELIVNNNFTGSNGWEILYTAYPASYSYAQYHSPYRSMQTGIVNSADNTYSYSDFRQVVNIPSNASHVTLRMWVYPISGESPMGMLSMPIRTQYFGLQQMSDDVQYLLILDQYQNWIGTLLWMRTNSQVWTYMQFDLSAYAGRQIMLQWGSYNNGYNGITAMYVDDVSLQSCP